MKTLFVSTLFLVVYLVALTSFTDAAGLSDSVALYFSLDQANTANDLSGQGNNGKVFGTQLVAGKIKNGFQYSKGTADYIEITDAKGLSPVTQITLAAWVKILAPIPSASTFICGINADETDRLNMGFYSANGFHTNVCAKGAWGSELNVVDLKDKFVDAWHHVAGMYGEGGKARVLYFDGKEVGRDTQFQGSVTLTKLRVGRGQSNFDGWTFNGIIDEVYIFNRILTIDELSQVMNGNVTAVESSGKLATTWAKIRTIN